MNDVSAMNAPTIRHDLRLAPRILGAASVVVFGSLISMYYDLGRGVKPNPARNVSLDNYSALMITITLLMAATTVEWSARSTRSSDRSVMVGLLLTFGFGVAALNALSYTLDGLHFGVSTNGYGTAFYALIAASMINIAASSVLALVAALRSTNQVKGELSDSRVRGVATYWHFVVFNWLVVYAVLYLIR